MDGADPRLDGVTLMARAHSSERETAAPRSLSAASRHHGGMDGEGELDLSDLRHRAVMAGDAAVGRDLRALVAEVERLRAERVTPEQTVAQLLAGHARSLAGLRRRGVVRSANAPAGDYAEWLVAKALGGGLAESLSAKSWDVKLPSDERIQVKTRLVSVPPRPGNSRPRRSGPGTSRRPPSCSSPVRTTA